MASRTITTTAETLIPRNKLRKSLIFQNEDTTINVFIKQEREPNTTVSTTDHDHRITSGSTLDMTIETDGKQAVQERWTIVAASGTPRISFFETEDVER